MRRDSVIYQYIPDYLHIIQFIMSGPDIYLSKEYCQTRSGALTRGSAQIAIFNDVYFENKMRSIYGASVNRTHFSLSHILPGKWLEWITWIALIIIIAKIKAGELQESEKILSELQDVTQHDPLGSLCCSIKREILLNLF